MALWIWARARAMKHQQDFRAINTSLHGGIAELQCETLAAQHSISTEAAQGIDGYEYVCHRVMVGEASKESRLLGRLALQSARSYAAYAVKQAVAYDGLATEATITRWSIPPGCAMATNFMKLVLKPLLQQVVGGLELATIGNVVDDVSLQTFGPEREVVEQAIAGHDQLLTGLTNLCLKVNDKKTYVVGSSMEVVAKVYAHLAVKAEAKYTNFLGVLRSGEGSKAQVVKKRRSEGTKCQKCSQSFTSCCRVVLSGYPRGSPRTAPQQKMQDSAVAGQVPQNCAQIRGGRLAP
eukprot:4650574-Amphidinium_carterae.4